MLIFLEKNAYPNTSMNFVSACVLTSLIFFLSNFAQAQILPREDQQADAGLEDLYDKFENEEAAQKSKRDKDQKQRDERQSEKDITKLSELSTLAPFEDIAVLQRRFLPKTGRVELSGSLALSTNNQYFNNYGVNLRGAYYFQEKYGIEGVYQYLANSERPITSGLTENQSISTRSLVEPESFMGVTFKWTPLYGKMAWFQKRIIPFDIYFTPGVGVSNTASGGSASTMTLGMGQLFALNKSYGVRWDFNWNYYQTEVDVTTTGGGTVKESRNQSDLFLGIGFSYFIPEAKYR
ncbi:MAG: outer membrane beta-barrel domain-containing protein [Bdellovibrionales bacterium]|nr:outer membrane beta-barrel domain-containing protein [Bdellovibrionales bacterium]